MGNRTWIILACWLMVAPAAAAEEVAIATFLQNLARENGFDVQGANLIGSDTFSPPANRNNIEKVVARALSRYNYVVTYANKQVKRVVVLGRKGDDIGAMPESAPEVQPET